MRSIKMAWWRFLGWHESLSIGQRFRIIVQALHCDQDHLNEMTDWGWFDHSCRYAEYRGRIQSFREAARWVSRYPDRAAGMLEGTADDLEEFAEGFRKSHQSKPRW